MKNTDFKKIHYSHTSTSGYECSSKGDKRFSALFAKMPDGRTIEQWYQCDIKGYDLGGTNWKLGKGKPPRIDYPGDELYQLYKFLWKIWAIHHLQEMTELLQQALKHDCNLTDMFAHTPINQARALSEILNEWREGEPQCLKHMQPIKIGGS